MRSSKLVTTVFLAVVAVTVWAAMFHMLPYQEAFERYVIQEASWNQDAK